MALSSPKLGATCVLNPLVAALFVQALGGDLRDFEFLPISAQALVAQGRRARMF